MNREEVIKKFIDATALRIAKLKFSMDEARETANNAPGPMQSASDTTKTEMNLLISGLVKQENRLSGLLKELYKISESFPAPETVCAGAIIKINKDNKEFRYLIMEDSGGIDVETDLGLISGLSPEAPLAEYTTDKRAGDSVMFYGQTIKIIEIV